MTDDNKELIKKANDALYVAKIDMMSLEGQAFISTVFFQLKFSWDFSMPTACTNGDYVKVNPNFFLSIQPKGRIFLLAHEAWHVALDHITRGDTLDAKTYNEAADYVINGMQVQSGFEMPKIDGKTVGLHNPDYYDMDTEEVYKRIKQSGSAPPPDMGGMGTDIVKADATNPGQSEKQKQKIDKIIKTAAITSAQANKDNTWGKIPGELEIYLQNLFNPKVDWKTLFANFFSAQAKGDYTFRRPNKRFLPDIIMPSLYSEKMNEVAFFCDSSGSVTDEDFNTFYNEVKYVKSLLNPKKLSVAAFDTTLKKVHEFSEDDEFNVQFTGRGGTRIQPVIEYINENRPEVCAIFTDGYFSQFEVECQENVLWLIYDNPDFTSEFGTIIHIEKEK